MILVVAVPLARRFLQSRVCVLPFCVLDLGGGGEEALPFPRFEAEPDWLTTSNPRTHNIHTQPQQTGSLLETWRALSSSSWPSPPPPVRPPFSSPPRLPLLPSGAEYLLPFLRSSPPGPPPPPRPAAKPLAPLYRRRMLCWKPFKAWTDGRFKIAQKPAHASRASSMT